MNLKYFNSLCDQTIGLGEIKIALENPEHFHCNRNQIHEKLQY